MKAKWKDRLVPVDSDTSFVCIRFNCPPTIGELDQVCRAFNGLNHNFPYLEIVLNADFEKILCKSLYDAR